MPGSFFDCDRENFRILYNMPTFIVFQFRIFRHKSWKGIYEFFQTVRYYSKVANMFELIRRQNSIDILMLNSQPKLSLNMSKLRCTKPIIIVVILRTSDSSKQRPKNISSYLKIISCSSCARLFSHLTCLYE